MLSTAQANGFSISELMLRNEVALASQGAVQNPAEIVREGIDRLSQAMQACVERGTARRNLPGGLNVRRRAKRLAERLRREGDLRLVKVIHSRRSTGSTVYAMAVNEENAAGGPVVTAPRPL